MSDGKVGREVGTGLASLETNNVWSKHIPRTTGNQNGQKASLLTPHNLLCPTPHEIPVENLRVLLAKLLQFLLQILG